jgi:hypothetical protein
MHFSLTCSVLAAHRLPRSFVEQHTTPLIQDLNFETALNVGGSGETWIVISALPGLLFGVTTLAVALTWSVIFGRQPTPG